ADRDLSGGDARRLAAHRPLSAAAREPREPTRDTFLARRSRALRADPGARLRAPVAMGMIEVLAPGLLTTVQDLGRYGYGRLGVSPGGGADTLARSLANLRV